MSLSLDIVLKIGAQTIGSCTMTMLLFIGLPPQMNFGQNTTFRCSHTLHTLLIMLNMTVSVSTNSKTMIDHRGDEALEIQANALRQMRALPESAYQRCFHDWLQCGISAYNK